jgi:deazaflavin-dependent oxidoreductase (nitroreductase family)
MATFFRRLGGTRLGVWLIKRVVSPLDKWLLRRSGGRRVLLGKPLAPTLLLTTRGRQSGQPRTTPVFYLRDGEHLVICNVNPGFERPNPWTLNIRAHPSVMVTLDGKTQPYDAREIFGDELERCWPQLVALWPAYQTHFERSGERSVFVLTPTQTV